MEQDTELFRQLINTFQLELDENLERLTTALLLLEKGGLKPDDLKHTLELIFRTAHNIKGTARSLGITDLADLAHELESLFTVVQKNPSELTSKRVDLCLEAVDALRDSLNAFIAKRPLNFDLPDLIKRIQDKEKSVSKVKEKKTAPINQEVESTMSDSIRVSLGQLDQIAALTEEMQISKIAVDDHYHELTHLSSKAKQFYQDWTQILLSLKNKSHLENKENLHKILDSHSDLIADLTHTLSKMQKEIRSPITTLSSLNNSLQTELRLLRLLPAATLTNHLPRTVRDLAKELNKNVNLEITGGEVKVDKVILEGLKDPLNHLLRNAIDHGIESEAEREEQGKSKVGKISLDIRQEGNQILVRLEDDGRGIDANTVAHLALSKNLISQSDLEKLSEEEKLKLIFQPGFSTKETVTAVSGRGFGLDAVRTNLEQLKGQVNVKTNLNQGTVFLLRLPLTLMSERGLMIRASSHLFAIPISDIERVLTLNANQILRLEASQAIQLDEHPIPLRSLADVLKLEKQEPALPDQLPIVVIRKGFQTMAFLVEDIFGEKEIVIKPLQAPLAHTPCIAGGTLSGSGQVILVLNPHDLIQAALHTTFTSSLRMKTEKTEVKTRPRILVVDDSITTRTLEKNVLESKDYDVTTAINGKEAWDILQKQPFSLLITDVSMPIMDGFTLTARVKQSAEFKNLPVIIVTSLGSNAEKQRGHEVGADAYIVKSEFESSQLLEIISQLVAS